MQTMQSAYDYNAPSDRPVFRLPYDAGGKHTTKNAISGATQRQQVREAGPSQGGDNGTGPVTGRNSVLRWRRPPIRPSFSRRPRVVTSSHHFHDEPG